MFHWIHRAAVAALLLLSCLQPVHSAWAAPRTICFELKTPDTRHDCPIDSPMATRHCDGPWIGRQTTFLVGVRYELWDRDGTDPANDEFIGGFVRGGEGNRCATFEWEGSAASRGEDDPDVYVKVEYLAFDVAGDMRLKAFDSTGIGTIPDDNTIDDVIRNGGTRFGFDTSRGVAVATNCQEFATCQLGRLIAAPVRHSNRNLAMQGLDSGFRTLRAFSGEIETFGTSDRTIDFYLFDVPRTHSKDNLAFSGSDDIMVEVDRADDAQTVPHELGHVVHSREKFGLPPCVCDYTFGGTDGHTLTSVEFEAEATAEGFAGYVAVRTWYDPELWTPVGAWQPSRSGRNFENSAPPLFTPAFFTPSRNELQVARAFWDLDDENVDGGPGGSSDRVDWTSARVLNEWASFDNTPAGQLLNRGSIEFFGNLGAGIDNDGCNVRDYDANAPFVAADREAAIQVNRLTGQTDL